MASRTVLVIGTGQAGVQVAASLRDAGFDGRILLVGDEPHQPYQRPPLSKSYLTSALAADALALKPEAFYSECAIDLVLGERVTAVDRRARKVSLSSGQIIAYDHLVFATGARNRQLGIEGSDLGHVVGLRDLRDATELRDLLGRVSAGVVVIGGGFIGLEVAAACEKLGLPVTIVEIAPRLMGRAVAPAISEFFAAAHVAAGADIRLNSGVRRLHGDSGRVRSVELSDGARLDADLVLVGIGVLPNDELATSCGLQTQDGILINDRLLTGDERVSAIGDCARYPNPYAGAISRLESVQNAVDQGRFVANRLLDRGEAYDAVPWFWSDQGDLKLRMAGMRRPGDETLTTGAPEAGAFSVFSFREGQLVACDSVNRPGDHMAVRHLLQNKTPVPRAAFDDPDFSLKAQVARSKEAAGAATGRRAAGTPPLTGPQ